MSQEKNTSWEERFDEEFDCVMWWGCYNKDGSQKHGYETDCGDELKSFIREAITNREKEIAEEVEEIQTQLHNGHFEEGYKLTNKLLSILKH